MFIKFILPFLKISLGFPKFLSMFSSFSKIIRKFLRSTFPKIILKFAHNFLWIFRKNPRSLSVIYPIYVELFQNIFRTLKTA